MHFLLGTKPNNVTGPDLTIDCLWCGNQQVVAHSLERTEWLTLFHLIPVLRKRTVFVRCALCGRDMIAKCSLEELAQSNPLTLKYLLVKRVSFVGKVCVVLGLLLCWAPLVGLIPAIIGFVYGRKYGGWMKTMCLWGLALSLISTLLGLAGFLVSK